MLTKSPRQPHSEDYDLCIRAAWLHYVGGLTQGDVAKRLGVPSLKAHRLIARANRDGLVQFSIDGDISECLRLEEAVRQRYGIAFCEVSPDLDDEELPLRTLGMGGSRFLRRVLESGEDEVVGFGHGRTLAASVAMLPQMSVEKVKLVSLLGGLTRRNSTTPYDVIHRLASRTGAECYVLPLPFYANSVEDHAVFMAQRGVPEVLKLGIEATLRLVGIGALEPDASIVTSGIVERGEIEAALNAGSVAEVLGHFFGETGQLIETGLSERTFSMSIDDIRRQKTIALAGGRVKVEAIKAALASGLFHGLITDERTARFLTA